MKKRIQNSILNAQKKFLYVYENFPNTEFAIDFKFKLDLIQDILAAKEMYLGRHYLKKEKWIASINRFKNILENFDDTIFVEEAIHRLVEIYYKIGLINKSKKYAKILGYNYQSGEWYKKTYKIFNRDYSIEISNEVKKDKSRTLQMLKKLFE